MSRKHPIIAITGSSGSGTTTVRDAFAHIFLREKINAAMVEGDSFHIHSRDKFIEAVAAAEQNGNMHLSHFGPDTNDFASLVKLFKSYGKTGQGQIRHYIHNDDEAEQYTQQYQQPLATGQFTPESSIPRNSDLLFYEGLHGMLDITHNDQQYNVAKYVDLGIGIVPIVNLEWIQKIHRDKMERGYDQREVVDMILRRMPDYVTYITPQFSLTDVNFQRVATVDTSNPFIARDIPTLDESFIVIRFRDPNRLKIDFQYLLSMLHGSFMSRRNTLVIPGGKMGMAIEVIFGPIIDRLIQKRAQSL